VLERPDGDFGSLASAEPLPDPLDDISATSTTHIGEWTPEVSSPPMKLWAVLFGSLKWWQRLLLTLFLLTILIVALLLPTKNRL